ncbi:hypothetical protein ADK60_32255 [Streptomyces sp. XY431]|uniref:HNH endonuclease signature motif containing protein n=1 Tax=Streptomyces sp. XY431 TaxID=1415562 RepID=UPI0006AEEAF5|nr:HNH endonuclease signature motif containing protein [Streptomyces sp. XY431]KOV12370.1 hypothetical protein ADK60_32255 [Streptomyces sp. XY431]
MSTFSPTPRLCKLLYGRALRCAYQMTCAEPLIEEHRGRLSTNSQIAHIRAESPGGPRFVPGFGPVNEEENLLLLCYKHHKWVDDHPELYTIEELLVWKKAQTSQRGEDAGLVLTDDQVQQIVIALTTPVAKVELLGLLVDARNGMTQMPVEALLRTKILNGPELGRYLGIRVTNAGAVPFDADTVGVDLEFGFDVPAAYQFPTGDPLVGSSGRLAPQSNAVWPADILTVGAGIREVMTSTLHVPTQVRPYAFLGDGSRPVGSWLSAVHLPVWKEGMTQEQLDELARRAEERRRGGLGSQLGATE